MRQIGWSEDCKQRRISGRNSGLKTKGGISITIVLLEERGVKGGSARRSSLKGHNRQSDEHWNRFKGDVWGTSERWGGALVGFSGRIDTILN